MHCERHTIPFDFHHYIFIVNTILISIDVNSGPILVLQIANKISRHKTPQFIVPVLIVSRKLINLTLRLYLCFGEQFRIFSRFFGIVSLFFGKQSNAYGIAANNLMCSGSGLCLFFGKL
jgi:hypothetical protein